MSDNAHEWGYAAFGRHGSIAIDLAEPIGRDGPWQLHISGNEWQLSFDVAGANTARDFSAFVKEHANRKVFAEHRVGLFQGAEVIIVKDSEFADRFWLRILGAEQMAEVTLQDDGAVDFEKALQDLVSDLT